MEYRIYYFANGVPRGDSPCEGPLQNAKREARDGMARFVADSIQIYEVDAAGERLVWEEKRPS